MEQKMLSLLRGKWPRDRFHVTEMEAMEKLYHQGYIRHVDISSMSEPYKYQWVLTAVGVAWNTAYTSQEL